MTKYGFCCTLESIIVTIIDLLQILRAGSNSKLLVKDLSTKLINNNIRPSHQRIKILEYLIKNQCHPAVDQIFIDLQSEIPTLSKATIYNTLHLFVEAGLVRALNLDDNETRYDIITETHGHFKCNQCGTIFNFNLGIDSMTTEKLARFRVIDKTVYFKGVCPKCLLSVNLNNRKEQN